MSVTLACRVHPHYMAKRAPAFSLPQGCGCWVLWQLSVSDIVRRVEPKKKDGAK